MKLSLRGFGQLIEDMSAALQSSATALVDVSVGSVVRAIFEANASVVLWLQWLILQVLQITRASTSAGADLDSWMADFGLSRRPAAASTGKFPFSRLAPINPRRYRSEAFSRPQMGRLVSPSLKTKRYQFG